MLPGMWTQATLCCVSEVKLYQVARNTEPQTAKTCLGFQSGFYLKVKPSLISNFNYGCVPFWCVRTRLHFFLVIWNMYIYMYRMEFSHNPLLYFCIDINKYKITVTIVCHQVDIFEVISIWDAKLTALNGTWSPIYTCVLVFIRAVLHCEYTILMLMHWDADRWLPHMSSHWDTWKRKHLLSGGQ